MTSKAPIAENFDRLVDIANRDAGDERTYGLLFGRVGVPDEHDVSARFIRSFVTRNEDAAVRIVVPVAIFFDGGILFFREHDFARGKLERGFDDDSLRMSTVG